MGDFFLTIRFGFVAYAFTYRNETALNDDHMRCRRNAIFSSDGQPDRGGVRGMGRATNREKRLGPHDEQIKERQTTETNEK